MHKKQGVIYFSPSDLTRYMESPFASWMDRFALETPHQTPEKDHNVALLDALAKKGLAHEDALEADFVQQGKHVIKIDGDSTEKKRARTRTAMINGADVIVQGRLELSNFGGYADFLVKVPGESIFGDYHYEIWDTKLSSKVKPTFLIQLCCYAEMLEALQKRRPEYLTVALGNGQQERFKTQDYYFYYQTLKTTFLEAQQQFSKDKMPDPAESSSWGDWSCYAEQLLLEKDHLFQVATITKGQIKKLNHAGIKTLEELASSSIKHVKGIHPDVLARLKSQAEIQLRTKNLQKSNNASRPCFEIIKPEVDEKAGLALLPPHSPLDVFFDIEGYPLDTGGLEYLWGCTYFTDQGERSYKDFWAHNPEQEKLAFQSFIEWVYARWKKDPSMHIYHYAHYEITACRKLMGGYGVCEYEVDQLLRNVVFVDLYKVVRGGVLLGEPRYSIKNVEHLYREKRETEVGSGADSVVVYEHWRQLNLSGDQGDCWKTSNILRSIRDYNYDDCNSTQELVDWLREQQSQHNIPFCGKTEVVEPEEKEDITKRIALRDHLLIQADRERKSDPKQAAITENLAWTLEFHRREAKPTFWRLFDRLGLSHFELFDDLDCLALCERTEREPFKHKPKAQILTYEYRFSPAQEFKGVTERFYLLGIDSDDDKPATVNYIKEESNLENGLIAIQSKALPPEIISLIPDEYVHPAPIPQAIEKSISEYEQGQLHIHQSAIIDFLTRSIPRFQSKFSFPDASGAIAPAKDPQVRLAQIVKAVMHLDASYLTIQGPPGAGKTYTGKHVIAELLKTGARIGIASNSHKAINHLLLNTAKYCAEQSIQASFSCTRETDPELRKYGISILGNKDLASQVKPSCVLGTTAWGFSRGEMAHTLDYLFVDESGQVAVANLIAMSRSAKNLILMGDQMQLGQPSQGTHPADSGLSVLDYLLHETPTIPADMGVFLDITYRMHPRVNRFVSDHIYEGKLVSHPDNKQRIIEVPEDYRTAHPDGPLDSEAGIIFVPVEHEGTTQASDEEVEKIKELAHSLLGRTFHTGEKESPTRLITWDDILFVAPYNHQVRKLKEALGDQAKVGSVDKFQGQEAPIVFLSMCASDPADSPRGLDFLFDKQRINVAISRAQTLAIVIANPAIGKAPASRVHQLKLMNLFNALVENE